MELKTYQKKVISDLTRFVQLLNKTENLSTAYRTFWEEQQIRVGADGVSSYHNIIDNTPHVCFKVPTGGGKTFLACNSIKPIFDGLSITLAKVVVWLVPSDSILGQTVKALKDVNHPYRQKIDVDFGGRVEVFTKQELLNGQNFNPTSVNEQLSIMVLSYDSFRSNAKEGRKAFQENSALAPFAKHYTSPETMIEDADETALIQVINQLSPLVIVDESHHAQSDLSIEMLKNFNPFFVLDLTATPKKNSNIISYVDAIQLKKENMVKLPVIVYNRKDKKEVMIEAVDLRNKLESDAKHEKQYIRPIVLFQAQPKGKDDHTTFEQIKESLINMDIPADQIAIKTASIDDLKNIDLMSKTCSIRYIITVNALKEGWDCPFAYILATIANRSSVVDVEQILGRTLRLPYTQQNINPILNLSYVLTSSDHFHATIEKVIFGLNNAGFSKKDFYATEAEEPVKLFDYPILQEQLVMNSKGTVEQEYNNEEIVIDFDVKEAAEELRRRQSARLSDSKNEKLSDIINIALEQNNAYMEDFENNSCSSVIETKPIELRDKMHCFKMNEKYYDEVISLRIPQFYLKTQPNLFAEEGCILLRKDHLTDGFTLKDKDSTINFDLSDEELGKIDIEDSKNPDLKFSKLRDNEKETIKKMFDTMPKESVIKNCKSIIHKQINKMNMIESKELNLYLDRIIDGLDKNQLANLETSYMLYAERIKMKIDQLLTRHRVETFNKWIEQGKIICQPSLALKREISPIKGSSTFANSLYTSEDGNMNGLESDIIMSLTALSNIKWWHRNISQTGFVINGFINHYPDFIVMTNSGKMLMIETKGDDRDNADSKDKIYLGKKWQSLAGENYRYYMVFANKDIQVDGAYTTNAFLDLLKEM